ncbi:LuxR C-terminal-related transcriptional regulator [Actinospica robiniae]|uniref:LuxR C-terminal-related transcriptional regulator n=1 Tax=Actinospica robiniae TaxID=304901 RepID=UPI000422F574|nr:LuxR C-terminal-related transcriptional regulator [Actinospica robiniae]
MLEALGLGRSAQALYTAMVSNPAAGVAELAEAVGLGETEVHDLLEQLVELSLVRPSRQHEGRLWPVDPAVGLQALLRNRQEELAAGQAALDRSQAAVKTLMANFDVVAPGRSDSEHLTGLDAVQDRLNRLLAGARSEVLSLVPGGARPVEVLEAARDADAGLLGRGVPIRVLYQDAIRNDPPTAAYARWMSESGAQVRTAPLLPRRLLLVDRKTALVPLDPADERAGAVATTNRGVIDQLAALFEMLWARASPIVDALPVDPATGLTGLQQQLLALLAAGATDEMAGRQLGLGERTVRRIMADLMKQLNARSRFEAGLRAKERGWL